MTNEWKYRFDKVKSEIYLHEPIAELALLQIYDEFERMKRLPDYGNKPASAKCPKCGTIIKTV